MAAMSTQLGPIHGESTSYVVPMPTRPMRGQSTEVEELEDGASDQEYMSMKAMADADHEVSTTLTPSVLHITHRPPNLKAIHTKPKGD